MAKVNVYKKPCVAVIADMVGSRKLLPAQRRVVQADFSRLIARINRRHKTAILAEFVITLGDECQGLLKDPAVLPDLIWNFDMTFPHATLRMGCGFGILYTGIGKQAINVDGPALHLARAAIDRAKKDKLLGGVFCGFGKRLDPILNGVGRLLWHQRSTLTRQEREVTKRLHVGLSQIEAARELGITKQAVSLYAAKAGWDSYLGGEEAMRAALDFLRKGIDRIAS